MIKDTRYIIKRVIIGVLICLTLSFIRSCEVKALSMSDSVLEVINTYHTTSGGTRYQLNYDAFHSASSGNSLFLDTEGQIIPIVMHTDSGNSINLYGRYTFCGDGNFTGGWEVTHAKNVNFVNTKIPCNFYGSSYVGKITFANYEITNVTILGTDRYTFNTTIASAFSGNASWQAIAHELSFNQFPTYYPESKVFDSLDSAISAINGLNATIGNVTSAINANGTAIGTIINNNTNSVISAMNIDSQAIINAINNQSSQAHTDSQNEVNAQNQTTNAVNETNNTIKDDNVDDQSNNINDMNSKIATNSVISDLLLLPVTLFQNILNSINGTCSPWNLGALLGTNLVLPCINLSNLLGSALYGVIDVLLSGIFVLSIRKRFVDIFQNITSLKDGGNQLE